MGFGLIIWCGAAAVCGYVNDYWLLVLARMVSGVGEASFQTIAPPFIDDFAPEGSKVGHFSRIFRGKL